MAAKRRLVFLGRELSEQRDYSEAVAKEIDHEVKAIVDHAYATAHAALNEQYRQAHAWWPRS